MAPALHKLGAVMIPATHMLTVDDLVYRINTADITVTQEMTTAPETFQREKPRPESR